MNTPFHKTYTGGAFSHLKAPLVRSLAVALLMSAASGHVFPQAHTRQVGDYTLRSSTIATESIPEESAREYGITRDPRRAILNVTVLKKEAGADVTVPAQVRVYARNLLGQRRNIEMRKIAAGGRVNYLGTYEFSHGEVLDFTITAKPQGSSETLNMTFRDRLWTRSP